MNIEHQQNTVKAKGERTKEQGTPYNVDAARAGQKERWTKAGLSVARRMDSGWREEEEKRRTGFLHGQAEIGK